MLGGKMEGSKLIICSLIHPNIHFLLAARFESILKKNLKTISVVFISSVCKNCKLSAILHFLEISFTVATLKMEKQPLIVFVCYIGKNESCGFAID